MVSFCDDARELEANFLSVFSKRLITSDQPPTSQAPTNGKIALSAN